MQKCSRPLFVAITVVVVLFFGLRPKEWSSVNNVHWLASENALDFRCSSIAFVADLQSLNENSEEFTIQLPIVPAGQDRDGFNPIIMIHDGDDLHQFTIWQWGTSLIVMNGNDYDASRRVPRISGQGVLRTGEESLITVTTGSLGTRLYINGVLVAEQQNLQLTFPNSHKTRLILGNSVYGKHPWSGKMFGLALIDRALSLEGVENYYKKWTAQRHLLFDPNDEPLLLYNFSEYEDGTISDETGRNQSLVVPQRLVVLKKTFLAPPWQKRRLNLLFFVDVVLNIIGFIPVGVIFYFWVLKLVTLPQKYEVLIVVVCCFLLSFSIETIQVWLPYRYSSSLDLMFNTFGGWLGAIVVGKNTKLQLTD